MGPVVAAIQVIATVAAANTIQGFIVRTVLTIASSMLFQALTPKPKGGAAGSGAASGVEQQRQLGEATPRAIALGWTIVAGSEGALWASGDSDDNRYNTRVIVISDWPTTLQKVWVRGREITFEGDINTGWFACNQYRSKTGAARLWMRFIRGDWNQAADPLLVSYANANGSWTSEDRLRGVSALLIRREYDVDAFQSGAPDNDDLRVEVRNAPVYDWRDVTQNVNDVTTWKPSENPVVLVENALCLLRAPAQYSPGSTDPIVGPGLDFNRRPLAKLTAMANICDELVSGQPRYRAGGVVRADMTGRDIIGRFAAACAGSWVSSGEGGYLRPGYVPAPVMDIPAGALQASSSDRYDPWARPDAVVNTVIGSYPDPSQAWQITPLPPASDAAWVATDGGVRAAQEDLSFVPYRDQAWRISTRKARGFRLMGSRDFTGPHWLIELEPGDVVTAPDPALPYLATKWWMVQRVVLLAKEDGLTVQITLIEIDSAIDAAPPAIGAPASFTPSSLSRALAVPPVTIGQRLISAGSSGQFPELTFLIPDSAPQASGVVQLQGPSAINDTPSLAAAQIRNINLSRGLLVGEPVVPGFYRWRAAGRDVDGSVGAFDATWQAAVQVTAPLVAGQAATGIGGAPILNTEVGLGGNSVVNSDFRRGLYGFTALGFNTSGLPMVRAFEGFGPTWTPYAVSQITGTPAAGNVFDGFVTGAYGGLADAQRFALRVNAGDRIWASFKLSTFNCIGRCMVAWLDQNGAVLSEAQAGSDSGPTTGFYTVPSSYLRTGGFLAVPANAFYAIAFTRFVANGGANPHGLQIEAQLTRVAAGQTVAPPYVSGPPDPVANQGGTIGTDVRLPDGNVAPIGRVDNLYNPIGTNQVINSDFNQGTTGFFFTNAYVYTGTGVSAGWGRNLPGWFGVRNVLWAQAFASSGTIGPAGGGYLFGWADNGFYGGLSNLNRYATRVKAGDRVFAAHLVAAHRSSTVGIEVRWFDKDGNLITISQKKLAAIPAANFANGDPANAQLVFDFFTAPAGAAFASTCPFIENVFAGVVDTYIFHSDPMVCVVPANQVTPPVYTPGPVDRAADRTAEQQRSIVPQFPVIEIKQGEAGHTGNRTITHAAFAGSSGLSGGVWSLPATNLFGGSASINSVTGIVILWGINQSCTYTIRYTHTDGIPTDLAVNVTFFPTPPSSGGGGSKIARADTATGIASGTYNAVLSATINSGPTGLARVDLNYLPLTWSGGSTNFQFRLTRAGVMVAETGVFNGIDGAGDIGDFLTEVAALAGFYSVAAGTAVWALEARRTSGTGTINTAAGELVVEQTET